MQVLIRSIRDYIANWNANPRPFQWAAISDEVLAKVQLVQTSIRNSSTTTASKSIGITRN